MAIYTRTQQKHDIEANWIKAINFIPLEGEIIIYDTDENYSYQRIKIGDGTTKVNDLPFDNIQGDWTQRDETAPDYIKNKTHYEYQMFDLETTSVNIECSDWGSGNGFECCLYTYSWTPSWTEGYDEEVFVNFIEILRNSKNISLSIGETYSKKISLISEIKNNPLYSCLYVLITLEDNNQLALASSNIGGWCYPSISNISDSLMILLENNYQALITYEKPVSIIQQLDEKFIPATIARTSDITNLINAAPEALDTLNELSKALGDDPNFSTTVLTEIGKKVDKVNGKGLSTNDYTTNEKNQLATLNSFFKDLEPIDLFSKLKIHWEAITDWPKEDIDIVNLFQAKIQEYSQVQLFELFDYFYNKYNNLKIMPVFKIIPYPKDDGFLSDDSRYVRLCSVLRIELDSTPSGSGSPVEQQFDLKYFIDLSDNNILKINFNYSLLSENGAYRIPWEDLSPSNGIMLIDFELIQKGSNIDLVAMAEEQIISPMLSEEAMY